MGTTAMPDGRIVPDHFGDASAGAAALGDLPAPPPQFPGAVPAPNPNPTAIPMPKVAAGGPRRGAPRAPKLGKPKGVGKVQVVSAHRRRH